MKNKVSQFVGLPSRKERRKQANVEGMVFVPQYNGNEPERASSKKAIKAKKNDITYNNKLEKEIK